MQTSRLTFYSKIRLRLSKKFNPLVKMETIRILLCIGHQLCFTTKQLDVETAFLHGELREGVQINQPEGYQQGDEIVCRLNESIYGLKQASRN